MSNWYFGIEEDYGALMHYGVLGMRWGVRKDRSYRGARRKAKAKFKRTGDKTAYKNELAAAREKTLNRLYSKNSKKLNEKIANESMGKTLVKSYLMGSYGAAKYNKARAEGDGRLISAGKNWVKGTANRMALNIPGNYEQYKNWRARKKRK